LVAQDFDFTSFEGEYATTDEDFARSLQMEEMEFQNVCASPNILFVYYFSTNQEW
jgi:hypothetical protein